MPHLKLDALTLSLSKAFQPPGTLVLRQAQHKGVAPSTADSAPLVVFARQVPKCKVAESSLPSSQCAALTHRKAGALLPGLKQQRLPYRLVADLSSIAGPSSISAEPPLPTPPHPELVEGPSV